MLNKDTPLIVGSEENQSNATTTYLHEVEQTAQYAHVNLESKFSGINTIISTHKMETYIYINRGKRYENTNKDTSKIDKHIQIWVLHVT